MIRFSAWIFLVGMLLAATGAWAQGAAYGDWQLYLPARHPQGLANAGNRLYVIDQSSFYFYDKDLHTTQVLSRRDGLSDVGATALAYDSASAQLVIVYKNGNIDLLGTNGKVRNISDLLRKESQVAKAITQVQVYNGLAYVSTNLGVVVLDLAKGEVRDTYSAIGPGGQAITAYAAAVLHDTIYAATSMGILRGRISPAINLLDYRSWTTEMPFGASTPTIYSHPVELTIYRGHLVMAAWFRGVDYLAGVGPARAWHYSPNSYGDVAIRLHVSAGQLLVSFQKSPLRRFDAATGLVVDVLPATAVGTDVDDAVRALDGTYYVASFYQGLLRFAPGTTTAPELIQPNAPETAFSYSLLADAATNILDVFSGGYSGDNGLPNTGVIKSASDNGFYEYKDQHWTNYTPTAYPSAADYPNLRELSHGTRTPDGTLYIASYGNGLLEWRGVGQFRRFTEGTPGSPLLSSQGTIGDLNYVRVTDVATDPGGSYLWVVNRHQRPNATGLFRFRPATATWKATPAFAGSDNLDRIVVDNFGNPWATQSRKGGQGLVAFDTASQRSFLFTVGNGLPSRSSNALYSVARDRNGDIWVGTGAGVAVFSDPSQLVSAGSQNTSLANGFRQPVVRKGTGTGFEALYNESVRCIAIDGANRKWFGTPNGLWLFNADATEALLNFTTANSPLPSNSINDVAVNDKTGEVFVATDAGVVSYQGSASVTDGPPSCAQVSPNPVRPDFAGTVGIRGVANNAQVRITDVAGHLVFSTKAAGGTVTWNLADTDGRRVHSGVYLVLTSDADGKNTCVSKVAVLSR
ncbi:two-component regulator propeller domain-containing protein [Hymenobacter psoromatis]|uniref:type IX secretion system anionic LPS delivery protein PorZ n=1 Tax=Hymenobacter psoromatis TaxID=1484116 RepID=UPI001CBCBDFC|nr:two-component regulator propeller domain-containing protein [Hymenobacter psoromatis]